MEFVPLQTADFKKRHRISRAGAFSILAHGLHTRILSANSEVRPVGPVMLNVEVLICGDASSPEVYLEFTDQKNHSTAAYIRDFHQAAIDAIAKPDKDETAFDIAGVRYWISTHQMFERVFKAAPALCRKPSPALVVDDPRTATFDLGVLDCLRYQRGQTKPEKIPVGVLCEVSVGQTIPETDLAPVALTFDIGCNASRIMKFDLKKDEILAFCAVVLASREPMQTPYNMIAIDVGREILGIPALPVYSLLQAVDPSIFAESELQARREARAELIQLSGYVPPPKSWDHLDDLEAQYRKPDGVTASPGI